MQRQFQEGFNSYQPIKLKPPGVISAQEFRDFSDPSCPFLPDDFLGEGEQIYNYLDFCSPSSDKHTPRKDRSMNLIRRLIAFVGHRFQKQLSPAEIELRDHFGGDRDAQADYHAYCDEQQRLRDAEEAEAEAAHQEYCAREDARWAAIEAEHARIEEERNARYRDTMSGWPDEDTDDDDDWMSASRHPGNDCECGDCQSRYGRDIAVRVAMESGDWSNL